MSQKSRLLAYLEQHGDITRGDAFMELGIANLWARVLELEALGWTFDRKSVQVPVRGGGYTTVTRYTLISAPTSQPGQGAPLARAEPPPFCARPDLFFADGKTESLRTVGE